ncbi:unnamed protein product [Prorocentrum cordatum]|uniref:Uncharacterized protein n=1 Tax=Prorocentrum cordatum TaxID=2364126 RepID=A0ABN9Y069_9DINO|nr:unnamed protein product [Polarella glacialis]
MNEKGAAESMPWGGVPTCALPCGLQVYFPATSPDPNVAHAEPRFSARTAQCMETLREWSEIAAIDPRGVRMGEAAACRASDAPKIWNISLVDDWENIQDSLLSSTEDHIFDRATEINHMCDIEVSCGDNFELDFAAVAGRTQGEVLLEGGNYAAQSDDRRAPREATNDDGDAALNEGNTHPPAMGKAYRERIAAILRDDAGAETMAFRAHLQRGKASGEDGAPPIDGDDDAGLRAAHIELARQLEEHRDSGPESFADKGEKRGSGFQQGTLEWSRDLAGDAPLELLRRLSPEDGARARRFLRARYNAVEPRCLPTLEFGFISTDLTGELSACVALDASVFGQEDPHPLSEAHVLTFEQRIFENQEMAKKLAHWWIRRKEAELYKALGPSNGGKVAGNDGKGAKRPPAARDLQLGAAWHAEAGASRYLADNPRPRLARKAFDGLRGGRDPQRGACRGLLFPVPRASLRSTPGVLARARFDRLTVRTWVDDLRARMAGSSGSLIKSFPEATKYFKAGFVDLGGRLSPEPALLSIDNDIGNQARDSRELNGIPLKTKLGTRDLAQGMEWGTMGAMQQEGSRMDVTSEVHVGRSRDGTAMGIITSQKALEAVGACSAWNPGRRFEAGLGDGSVCPMCGDRRCDDYHKFRGGATSQHVYGSEGWLIPAGLALKAVEDPAPKRPVLVGAGAFLNPPEARGGWRLGPVDGPRRPSFMRQAREADPQEVLRPLAPFLMHRYESSEFVARSRGIRSGGAALLWEARDSVPAAGQRWQGRVAGPAPQRPIRGFQRSGSQGPRLLCARGAAEQDGGDGAGGRLLPGMRGAQEEAAADGGRAGVGGQSRAGRQTCEAGGAGRAGGVRGQGRRGDMPGSTARCGSGSFTALGGDARRGPQEAELPSLREGAVLQCLAELLGQRTGGVGLRERGSHRALRWADWAGGEAPAGCFEGHPAAPDEHGGPRGVALLRDRACRGGTQVPTGRCCMEGRGGPGRRLEERTCARRQRRRVGQRVRDLAPPPLPVADANVYIQCMQFFLNGLHHSLFPPPPSSFFDPSWLPSCQRFDS